MRSSEEIEVEERALLDVAVSRAERMTLSWPAVTSAGEESLPSFVLGTFSGEVVSAQPLPPTSVGAYRPPSKAGMVEPEAIRRLMGDGKSWRPTEIECFLQCAFQYLGRYTLKLQPPPPGPSERFDARAQGTLAHKILRRVSENPAQDLTAVLDEELHLLAQRDRIPDSHSMLWHRTAMLRVLRLFLDAPPEREGWHREYEWPFEFDVVEGVRIKGRIDRFDSLDRRAFAIDYKYSKSTRLRKSEAVQGGLYLLGLRAAGFTPEGFAYIALREDGETVYYAPEPLMPESRERTIQAVTAIAQGDVAVRPADATLCRFCDFRAACRVSQTVSIASAEGGA
jgi:RecB family exonuclease